MSQTFYLKGEKVSLTEMYQFSEQYCQEVSVLAVRALILEVITTPKPGLVDAINCGSHKDMDVTTFLDSSLCLMNSFRDFLRIGMDYDGSMGMCGLMEAIRPAGRRAETIMLEHTNGVNTHKGIIFSLGIVCAALGYMWGWQIPYERATLSELCASVAGNIMTDFEGLTAENARTHGEKIYTKYGIAGVRGEAAEGFPSVFCRGLNTLYRCLEKGWDLNSSSILVLLEYIGHVDDTNIITRSDYDTMKEIQVDLQNFFSQKKITREQIVAKSKELDLLFINKNISPGGSADLLALTLFLFSFERKITKLMPFSPARRPYL